MREPRWLHIDSVLRAHSKQLARHCGIAGVRDLGLLESALSRPRNRFAYSSPDLAALAACYAHGLVRNHPFLDGNKRTALVACRAFLLINGLSVDANQDDKATQILRLASSAQTEEEFAQWLRSRLATRSN